MVSQIVRVLPKYVGGLQPIFKIYMRFPFHMTKRFLKGLVDKPNGRMYQGLLLEVTNLANDVAYASNLAMKHVLGINTPANQGQFQVNFKSDEEYLKSRSIKLSIRGLHEVDVGLTPDLMKSYVTEAVKKKKP